MTKQTYIAKRMVAEFFANGDSLLFRALNDAFSHPQRFCPEPRCLNELGQGDTHCDDCAEMIRDEDVVEQGDTRGRRDWAIPHMVYMRAAWPRV